MSERSQVSKVTLCVEILKWRSLTDLVTKGRFRAARVAKNTELILDYAEAMLTATGQSGLLLVRLFNLGKS